MDTDTIAIIIPIIAIVSLFIVLPAMLFHYITVWRKQRTLEPDDERMLEDLWRSARAMERRIESLEAIIEGDDRGDSSRPQTRDPHDRRN